MENKQSWTLVESNDRTNSRCSYARRRPRRRDLRSAQSTDSAGMERWWSEWGVTSHLKWPWITSVGKGQKLYISRGSKCPLPVLPSNLPDDAKRTLHYSSPAADEERNAHFSSKLFQPASLATTFVTFEPRYLRNDDMDGLLPGVLQTISEQWVRAHNQSARVQGISLSK